VAVSFFVFFLLRFFDFFSLASYEKKIEAKLNPPLPDRKGRKERAAKVEDAFINSDLLMKAIRAMKGLIVDFI
jgi:hypothetical protein